MRKLLSALPRIACLAALWMVLVCALPSWAQTSFIYRVTITVTNQPTAGNSLTINGNTRRWTNNTLATPNAWILINTNGVLASKTNLYTQIATFPYTAPFLTLLDLSTNQFQLIGSQLSASISGTWASLTIVTQGGPRLEMVQVPPGNYASPTNATNHGQWLVDFIGKYGTNRIPTNAVSMQNFLNKGASPLQTVTGPVAFQDLGGQINFLSNGVIVGVRHSNSILHSASGILSNQFIPNSTGSNFQNIGNAISSPGTNGSNSEQFGKLARAIANSALAVGNQALASAGGATAVGQAALAAGDSAIAVGAASVADHPSSIAIGTEAVANATNSIAIGTGAGVGYSRSVAIGNGAQATRTNQLRLGNTLDTVSIPGDIEASAYRSVYATGSNRVDGMLAIGMTNIATLANGNNILNPGSNVWVRLSGGPSSAFSVNSIQGGYAGRVLFLLNDTAQPLTLAHQSGFDPTNSNRIIITGTNVDLALGTNAIALLIYSGSSSRWLLGPSTVNGLGGGGGGVVTTNSLQFAPATFTVIGGTNVFFSDGGYVTNIIVWTTLGNGMFIRGLGGLTVDGGVITVTNGAITAPGDFASSEEFGAGAATLEAFSVAVGRDARLELPSSVGIGYNVLGRSEWGTMVGNNAYTDLGTNATAIGSYSQGLADDATALGANSTAGFDRSTAVGAAVTTTKAGQTRLGLSTGTVSIPGYIEITPADNVIIRAGGGSPEGSISAGVGSLWLRTNGAFNTTLYVKTNGTSSSGWEAIASGSGGGGGGEANVNGEVSVTNATVMGLVFGKSGITNLLRSLQAGFGLILTNQGTNIVFALLPTWQNGSLQLTNLSGTGAYTNIMEEGTAITGRQRVNFIGSSITVADNSGAARTDITMDSDVDAVAGLSGTGVMIRTGTGSATTRTLTGGNGISIANGDGVSGAPTFTATHNSNTQRVDVAKNSGSLVGSRKELNFIEGANVTLTISDDAGNDEIDITIAASGGGGSGNYILQHLGKGTNTSLFQSNTALPALTVQGLTGNGTNIVEWQNTNGTVLGAVLSNGFIVTPKIRLTGSGATSNWVYTATNSNGEGEFRPIASQVSASSVLDYATGNDATAQRGRMDLPYKTFSSAVTNMLSGDTLYILSGVYSNAAHWTGGTLGHAGFATNKIFNKTDISIIGIGRPVIFFTNDGNGFVISNCVNTYIEGVTFWGTRTNFPTGGTNAYLAAQGLVTFLGNCNGAVFRDVTFTNHHGFGILDYGYPGGTTDNVLIDNCKFLYCGATNLLAAGFADGSAINIGGDHWMVRDSFVGWCGRGIEVFVGAGISYQHDITIQGCTLVSNYQRYIFCEPATEAHGVRILNNYILGDSVTRAGESFNGIAVSGSTNVLIQGNTITNFPANAGVGMRIMGGNHIDVFDNTILDCNTAIILGITGNTVTRSRVSRNFIRRVEGQGIYCIAFHNGEISDNRIMDVGLAAGGSAIYLEDTVGTTTNVVITGNQLAQTNASASAAITVAAGVDNAVIYQNNIGGFAQNVSDSGNNTRFNWGSQPLQVQSGKLPSTNMARIDASWQNWELQYARTNAQGASGVPLSAAWQFVIPPDYETNTLALRVLSSIMSTNGPNSSNVIWRASILRVAPTSSTDIHTAAFGTTVTGTNTWTASHTGTNKVQSVKIDLGSASAVGPGDLAILKLERNNTDDTYVGVSSVVGLIVEWRKLP